MPILANAVGEKLPMAKFAGNRLLLCGIYEWMSANHAVVLMFHKYPLFELLMILF